MRTIIVDDEKHCRNGLNIMLDKYCEGIEVITMCTTGKEGIRAIEQHRPNLVFLDIEMPGMNGFEMLEQCTRHDFEIIFTTAYNEYAIQAIRHSALDYLLKPVDKDELIKALERARQEKNAKSADRVNELLDLISSKKDFGQIALPTLEGLMMINTADILYCESESAYTRFFMTDKKCITISKVLKDTEELLSGKGFFRVHNSYLINMRYVNRYIRGNGGEVIMNDGKNIPVSRTKRQDFLDKLEKL
jgi:two-component system, LytTR family, response regulator